MKKNRFYSTKANKPHKCTFCNNWIEKGQNYLHTWEVWQGKAFKAFFHNKDCMNNYINKYKKK